MISASDIPHYIVIISAVYFLIITVVNIRFIEYLIDPNKKWVGGRIRKRTTERPTKVETGFR